ncbi:hypothetical protein SGUI_1290 [Serinicoccus hydrothermalis]|uniref:Uncharacterized protein n=1 Tax=Serinicoccus hydrothermalis TaxID=1758689 RepID=A0A1B1NB80_9MICO|nr:hypothetical protein [Serinicoccus hydrothermalis]ANS78686.1 hypothetical protein SGUI_1290 [Serinicoccus hydrothermalis]
MTERDLLPLVHDAQQVAGLLAARRRGQEAEEDLALLLRETDAKALAGGAMLLADVDVGLLSHLTGEDYQQCVRRLTVDLESAVAGGGSGRPAC